MTQSNYPPNMPPGMPPSMRGGSMQYQPTPGTNGFAVASLICSIVGFCAVFIGGLLGILFGVLGISKAKQTNGRGKGMAIAGIVIGIITLITSGLLVAGGYGAYFLGKKVAGIAREFATTPQVYVEDLSTGKIDEAQAMTSGLSRDEIQAQSTSLQGMGAFQRVEITKSDSAKNATNGTSSSNVEFTGNAYFANGTKTFHMTINVSPNGAKITKASFE
jgi:hypothetical protein